jgi:hypothetical protein
VPRGRYRGRLKTALKELIDKHAQALTEDDLNAIADRGSVTARELEAQLENDPDRYGETVTASIKSDGASPGASATTPALSPFDPGRDPHITGSDVFWDDPRGRRASTS